MLDVGCGTGHVCRHFADKFQRVVGIDPSEPMLAKAAVNLAGYGSAAFEFHRLRAEDLPGNLGTFRLITFGASFHRTVRDAVAEVAYDMLESGGGLALLFPSTSWAGERHWHATVRRIVEKWTGKTFDGDFEPSQQVIERSRFRTCQVNDFREQHTWTAAELVGSLFSTSYCSRRLLGPAADDFAVDLTDSLLSTQADGRFDDILETTVVLARK